MGLDVTQNILVYLVGESPRSSIELKGACFIMDWEAFQQFLKNKYQKELQHAQQRALYHQRLAKWSEWRLIIISGITTILLAISSFLNKLPIVPLTAVCSAFVTVIAATMKSLRMQE